MSAPSPRPSALGAVAETRFAPRGRAGGPPPRTAPPARGRGERAIATLLTCGDATHTIGAARRWIGNVRNVLLFTKGQGSQGASMISPYVRRLRLAAELRALRTHAGVTHVQLAKQIGQSRAQISRLENGHVVDQDDVMKILDALGVDDERWTQIMTIAREAGERGWWESNRLDRKSVV